MKVKRFENIWTMGLILCFGLLAVFYVAKIFFPHWIVGVAQIESVVAFGDFVDAHKWSYHIFEIVVGTTAIYIYTCACCGVYKLDKLTFWIVPSFVLALRATNAFFPQYYVFVNCIVLVLVPCLVSWCLCKASKEVFFSTVFCFTADIVSQILSLEIRDLTTMVNKVNTATFMILMMDAYIVKLLLYFYFNYKNKIKEG